MNYRSSHFFYLMIVFGILTSLIGFVQPLKAQACFSTDAFLVELVSDRTALNLSKTTDSEILMGLRFEITPPWKLNAPTLGSYEAKNSMPSGGPQISWDSSINVQQINIHWPLARSYSEEGLTFSAYEGEVLIPLTIKVKDPNLPLKVKLELTYSVCSTVCIPHHHFLTLDLAPGLGQFTKDTFSLQQALLHPSSGPATAESFWMMLMFAFLGGIILNFMPCVLPVLSFKFMSLTKKNSQDTSFRPGFLATFAGIMVSFLILGGLALVLDTLGEKGGWGLHFQQPLFLCFLSVITTLFACNLWGFYEIELPLGIRDKIGRFLSYEHEKHAGLVEDFIAGIFATLLATPCTAPFLGTALGYAFSRSGGEILVFFVVMGLGFALPYWAGALLPRHWLKLPRPGRWMERLSQALGGILLLTTLWLLWILSHNSSFRLSAGIALGCMVIGVLFWKGQQQPGLRHINKIVILGLFLGPFALPTDYFNPSSKAEISKDDIWQPFEAHKIPLLVQQGKTVIVDITAAWCLTCKLNKARIFENPEGKALLMNPEMIRMQGDWTRRDSQIGHYLTMHHRAGIPFTIVFGPQAPQGIILPELLTLQALKTALKQARPF